VAEALGLLTEVMDPKAFAPKFASVIDYFLVSVKKEAPSNQFPLISGLRSCLKVMCRDELCENEPEVEKLLERILATIHPIAAMKRNYNDGKALKCHAELLQCFEYLGKARLTQTLSFLYWEDYN